MLLLPPGPAVAATLLPALAPQPIELTPAFTRFDGVELMLSRFRSGPLEFETDALGPWRHDKDASRPDALLFKHAVLRGVTLTFVAFAKPSPARSDDAWKAYLRQVADLLGLQAPPLDETDLARTPALASWPVREALFTPPAPAAAERHLVAARPDGGGILLILTGPAAELARADRDLRLFLARLERK